MIIKKGTVLEVSHQRSGKWMGIATEDFDPNSEEFFPIALAQKSPVMGLSRAWYEGDEMPCRKELCSFRIKQEAK